jgi:hypothetical protein
MTNAKSDFPWKEDFIRKIFRIISLEGSLFRLQSWLEHKYRINVYELKDNEIISGRGRHPRDRISVEQIKSWQIYPEMVFDIVLIELMDGCVIQWHDRYKDLIAILKQVAADRELSA